MRCLRFAGSKILDTHNEHMQGLAYRRSHRILLRNAPAGIRCLRFAGSKILTFQKNTPSGDRNVSCLATLRRGYVVFGSCVQNDRAGMLPGDRNVSCLATLRRGYVVFGSHVRDGTRGMLTGDRIVSCFGAFTADRNQYLDFHSLPSREHAQAFADAWFTPLSVYGSNIRLC